jgi:hypothetical protein
VGLSMSGVPSDTLLSHEGDQRHDEKKDEQNLGDQGRSAHQGAETEDSGDDGDNEKYESILEHGRGWLKVRVWK